MREHNVSNPQELLRTLMSQRRESDREVRIFKEPAIDARGEEEELLSFFGKPESNRAQSEAVRE